MTSIAFRIGSSPNQQKEVNVQKYQVFLIRTFLGAAFAVILSRFFYPDANITYVAGLGVILVGLAYFAEYLRNRKKNP